MAKQDRVAKDKQRAAFMKQHKIDRTTGRCAVCYAMVTIDNPAKGTRYTHRCYVSKD